MGIFGDFFGGIGDILAGPVGQIGGQILLGREQARLQRRSGGGGGGRQVPVAGPPIAFLPVLPGRGAVTEFDPVSQDDPFLQQPVLRLPQPRDFLPDVGCPSLFVPTKTSMRPVRDLTVENPSTGKIEFWRHRGRPILFSGDLAQVKATMKIGRKFATRSAGVRRRKR